VKKGGVIQKRQCPNYPSPSEKNLPPCKERVCAVESKVGESKLVIGTGKNFRPHSAFLRAAITFTEKKKGEGNCGQSSDSLKEISGS